MDDFEAFSRFRRLRRSSLLRSLAHSASIGAKAMSVWIPLKSLDEPLAEDLHALLWCRLFVEGTSGDTWWTKWKCLRGAWIRWTGTHVNAPPMCADSWYIPTSSDGGCRAVRWEITHWMHLPDPPCDSDRSGEAMETTEIGSTEGESAGRV